MLLRGLRQKIYFGVLGAVVMAALLPSLALVRDTTGHDWYAAGKLVLTEAMIAIGFDASAPTEYRAADGSVRRLTRLRFTYTVEAWQARRHILSTISDNALLGAGAGFAGAFLLAVLSKVASVMRRERVSVAKPVPPNVRPGTKTGSCIAEVVSQSRNLGARIALLVTPAKMESSAGTVEQDDRAAPLPATVPDHHPTKEPRVPRLPEAAAAETGERTESENMESGRTHSPSEPSPRLAGDRGSGTVAKECLKHLERDDDVGWF